MHLEKARQIWEPFCSHRPLFTEQMQPRWAWSSSESAGSLPRCFLTLLPVQRNNTASPAVMDVTTGSCAQGLAVCKRTHILCALFFSKCTSLFHLSLSVVFKALFAVLCWHEMSLQFLFHTIFIPLVDFIICWQNNAGIRLVLNLNHIWIKNPKWSLGCKIKTWITWNYLQVKLTGWKFISSESWGRTWVKVKKAFLAKSRRQSSWCWTWWRNRSWFPWIIPTVSQWSY